MQDDARPYFRPDIEGLRAVAVIAVLLFHVGIPGLEGGFVGVDVFYVISGFLITGLLLREVDRSGRIDLVSFYARRFRRLLPAAFIVIAATTVASWFVLSSLRFPDVAGDAAASALYVVNYRFAIGATDYLASTADPSPLLHLWSLAVEEQFYLFWPLLILITVRFVSIARVGSMILAVALGSFLLSLTWTDTAAPWAFFSLPTRAWELALGGLVAVGMLRLPDRGGRWFAGGLGWLGLGMICASVVVIGTDTPYPGTAALLPVVGTVLLIVAGARAGAGPAGLLSTALPRWFGRISYALYLWHWPLLILGPIALGSDDLALRLVLVGVAIVLAVISTDYVEKPIRTGAALRLSSPRSIGLAVGCSVALAVGALALSGSIELPGSDEISGTTVAAASEDPAASASPTAVVPALPEPRWSGPLPEGLTPALSDARKDLPRSYADGCHLDFASVDPPACVYGSVDSTETVLLLGDSHAAQWLPALERLALERDWRLVAVTKSACPSVDLTVWNGPLKRGYRECDRFLEHMLDRVAEEDPSIVLVASAPLYEIAEGETRSPVADSLDQWGDGLERLLTSVVDRTGHVVLLADTPRLSYDPLECLASRADISECSSSRDELVDTAYAQLERDAASAAGVEIISPTDWVCPTDGCPLVRGETLVFRDRHHLSGTFVTLLADHLGAAIDATS